MNPCRSPSLAFSAPCLAIQAASTAWRARLGSPEASLGCPLMTAYSALCAPRGSP